jgi:hypothetical protein
MRIESTRPAKNSMGGWIHKLDKVMSVAFLETPKRAETTSEADWTRLALSAYQHEKATAARRMLSKLLGVEVSALERLEVGWGWDAFRRVEYTTWPERRPGNKVTGIIRRYWKGVSESGGNKLTMRGSKHGLYLPKDWWTDEGPVLVPEGGSDCAALLSMGLSAIGRPSNVGGINMLIGALGDSEHRPIIVLGERDRKPERVGSVVQCPQDCEGCSWCWPGRYGCIATAERLAEGLKRNILARLIPDGFKDARDYLNKATKPTRAKFLNRLAKV